MSPAAIKHVNAKLKSLPESLLVEVENYIDFLAFKYKEKVEDVPQWHQDIVLKRIQENQTPVDAFDMLKELK